ncbi:hypothetical protein B0H14DRAFT_3741056 [Mycena olivaceomarginata]|nr:hypothetical protein B0H14DRAFT_3741056 [Mycena olivaceomarginata]
MNNGLIINPTMLTWYLIRLPSLDTAAVHDLLFPHDPQDVPRAVQLLLGIIALRELNYGAAADTNMVSEVDALRLLASVIKSLLEPFTNTAMTLTQQSDIFGYILLPFLHSLLLLFQTMVKNTMFCLAKQQGLDPMSPFYLFQVGDNPLERLFGKLCMLGGHNSAMSYLQAIDRLGHVCDLQEILTKTFIAPEHYDYDTLFADEDIEMLRPWRGDKYPGVNSGIDRLMITPALPPSPALAPPPSPTLAPSPDPALAPALAPSPAPALATQSELNPEDSDEDKDNQGDGVSFEESIPADVAPELELPSGHGVTPSDYLNVNGKWVHKQRICRLVISKDFEPKSIVRLLRVCGHTKVNARPCDDTNIDPAALLGPNMFVLGDPILTLLCTKMKVSLAVLRTTTIHQDGVSRSSILTSTIQNPATKVKLTGQILSMILAWKTGASDLADQPPMSATVRAANWLDSESDLHWGWIWNGEYLKVDSVMRGTTT